MGWLRNMFMRNKKVVCKDYDLDGRSYCFCDLANSQAASTVINEIKAGEYPIEDITFEPGDVVVDIGAHVGVVSIWLASKYPSLKIYAYEPMTFSFNNLQENIKKNGVKNIEAYNMAVTKDGRDLRLIFHEGNTGGATGQLKNMELPGHVNLDVRSTTIDRIFEENGIKKCKLLKIDCEGSEHEVLLNCSILGRVENIRGEFHVNTKLESEGYSIEKLVAHCSQFVDPGKIKVAKIRMAE